MIKMIWELSLFLKLIAYHLTTNLTTKHTLVIETCGEWRRGRENDNGMVVELQRIKRSYRRFPLKIPTMKPLD